MILSFILASLTLSAYGQNVSSNRQESTVSHREVRPTTEIQKDKPEAWFLDWDFCTDNSNNSRVEKTDLKKGREYFHGLFDDKGWIKELRYYDQSWTHQWTKAFKYPSGTNGTSTFLTHSYQYLTPAGKTVDHSKREQTVKARSGGWADGTPKEKLREALGEPLVISTDAFGMEKWIYFDGISQHWYVFNKDGKLDFSNYKE
jgi:hypothetical protein